MTIKDFLKKVILPVVACLLAAALFYPLCVEHGECDYLKLWLLSGIPFGVHRMFVWIIPKGFDIGGTVGVLVFNLLIGGVIGGVILVWRLLAAAYYFVKGIASGILWITGKAAVNKGLFGK